MPTSKQWYTSANLAIADSSTASRCAHSSIWGFGAMLLGNLSGTNGPEGARPSSCYWTLEGSSNSITAGIDTTDRLHFAGAFTDADWIRANAGTAHTWFVIKSPSAVLDGPWYFCFDYIGPTNDQTCTIAFSKNVFSGGSTTARPTSTNESVLTSFQFCSTTAGAGKIHLNIDANGSFRWLRSRNGTGYFDTYISVESLVEYHTVDPCRTFCSLQFLDSGRGVMGISPTVNIRGMSLNGTSATGNNEVLIVDLWFYPASITMGAYTTTNVLDATVDALPCVYVYENTAGRKGMRGRFPDMWESGAQVATGSTFPSVGNIERVLLGSKMIAMSVAPSL